MSSSDQPVPVSGEDQPDPRVEAILRSRWIGPLVPPLDSYEAMRVVADLAAADSADRAAGIRRVAEASLKCPACECYYDANGVNCYRESDVDWVCTEMGDRS